MIWKSKKTTRNQSYYLLSPIYHGNECDRRYLLSGTIHRAICKRSILSGRKYRKQQYKSHKNRDRGKEIESCKQKDILLYMFIQKREVNEAKIPRFFGIFLV